MLEKCENMYNSCSQCSGNFMYMKLFLVLNKKNSKREMIDLLQFQVGIFTKKTFNRLKVSLVLSQKNATLISWC